MTDALVPVDVEALERLPFHERVDALGVAWGRWRRLETVTAWTFGRALRSLRNGSRRGEWGGILDKIGIERTMAHRLMRIADGYGDTLQVATQPSVDAAIKALGPARPAHEVPVEQELPEAEVEAVAEEAEVEAARQRAEQREARLEGWAIRTEHEKGTEIERLNILLDRADARDRDRVATINAGLKREHAKDRKLRDVCDAYLVAKPCACGSGAVHDDALLVRFFAVGRKAAA